MKKPFCKKCYGKLFCVHQQPEMEPQEIINKLVNSIIHKTDMIETFFKYMMPEYRTKMGGIRGTKHFFEKYLTGIEFSPNISIVDDFIEEDDCAGYFLLEYFFKGKKNLIKITMHRAYNYIDDKPIYDRFSKEKLFLYWRIVNIQPFHGYFPNSVRTTFSRF